MSDSFRHGKRIFTIRVEQRLDGKWHLYYCPDCRNPLFKYNGDLLAETPGSSPVELGFEIPCRNRECGRVVIVEGFVTKKEYHPGLSI